MDNLKMGRKSKFEDCNYYNTRIVSCFLLDWLLLFACEKRHIIKNEVLCNAMDQCNRPNLLKVHTSW